MLFRPKSFLNTPPSLLVFLRLSDVAFTNSLSNDARDCPPRGGFEVRIIMSAMLEWKVVYIKLPTRARAGRYRYQEVEGELINDSAMQGSSTIGMCVSRIAVQLTKVGDDGPQHQLDVTAANVKKYIPIKTMRLRDYPLEPAKIA